MRTTNRNCICRPYLIRGQENRCKIRC